MSSPSKKIWPDVGAKAPATILNRVVLPAPLGPMRPVTDPASTSRLQLFTALIPPNNFETLLTVIPADKAPPLRNVFFWVFTQNRGGKQRKYGLYRCKCVGSVGQLVQRPSGSHLNATK